MQYENYGKEFIMKIAILSLVLCLAFVTMCTEQPIVEKAPVDHIKQQLGKMAPVTLTADLSYLPAEEVHVIKLLVKASQIMDELFMLQVDEQNLAILKSLESSPGPDAQVYVDFFKMMFGPWDRLDNDRPFINSKPKPPGVAFYPEDMTAEEFNNWIKNHPEDKTLFESNFSVIRRKKESLYAIPYSEYYKNRLTKAADLLKQAADLTSDAALSTFLSSRADAFLSNDYYQSDMDWMDLAGDIEVVIGPYEVYEDKIFGYKAAFESFVCTVDHETSNQQKQIAEYLIEMEKALPIADKYKNFDRGASSPIKVVNLIFSAGDTKAGIQTTAFNLPNDERVREAKGSKKVMLKNVMHAKFDKCWIPIVETVLAPKDLDRVSFDAYFDHVLMHEVSHGLGPGRIMKNGSETTVNKELKDLYSTIEECKADVLGVYNVQFLIDKGVLPKSLEKSLYASNLGGMFRSIRFGIEEAHGGGVAIQLNYYLDAGGVTVDENGKFATNDVKMKRAVKTLATELLEIEAKGDYESAKVFIDKYKEIRPPVQAALDALETVPIDIRPIYPIENEL